MNLINAELNREFGRTLCSDSESEIAFDFASFFAKREALAYWHYFQVINLRYYEFYATLLTVIQTNFLLNLVCSIRKRNLPYVSTEFPLRWHFVFDAGVKFPVAVAALIPFLLQARKPISVKHFSRNGFVKIQQGVAARNV